MKKLLQSFVCILTIVAILCTTACGTAVMENATFGDVRSEYNTSLDLSENTYTENNAPSDYYQLLEFEDATLGGSCKVTSNELFSGGAGVTGLNSDSDSMVLSFEIENSGFYNLTVSSLTSSAGRTNYANLDGSYIGSVENEVANEVCDVTLEYIYLSAGTHEFSMTVSWGWVDYDCLVITASDINIEDVYNVTCSLSNENADDNTVRLYNFLCDIYGKYTLTGQFADASRDSEEYEWITSITGEEFAVLGLDMMNYTPVAQANNATTETVERAYDWYVNCGGIVQICWHWQSPEGCVSDNGEWYSSFYTEYSTIDLDKAMNGEDEELYNLLVEDMYEIASKLQILRDYGVPVLWRPLHEASGAWFWWGDCSAESYIALYRLMYEIFTEEYELTNLIWVWNGQDADWYPGDDVVDIIAWDIYPGENEYSSQAATFIEAYRCSDETKLVALSENGCIPDPDNLQQDNIHWLYWGVWSGDFVYTWKGYNESYTEESMLIKAYESDYTLTLDELPDLTKYRLS